MTDIDRFLNEFQNARDVMIWQTKWMYRVKYPLFNIQSRRVLCLADVKWPSEF